MSFLIAPNTNIIPHTIVYKGQCYDIKWVHECYHVKGYSIDLDNNDRITKVTLSRCFHPNATERFDDFIGVRCVSEDQISDCIYLCIPDEIKDKKFHVDIKPSDIMSLIGTWNLNECYYHPRLFHFKANPQFTY